MSKVNYLEYKISLSGLDVNYIEHGEGEAIIFLHNGGGFWQSWEYQLDHFSQKYKVFALDWPSFGESDSPEGLLSMETLYSALRDFIEIKGLDKVHIVGNCIGASAAYLYSIRHPEKVEKLVLFNLCPGDLIFPRFIFRSLIPGLNKHPRSKRIAERILKFAFLKTPIRRKFPSILFGGNFNSNDSLFIRYVEKFKKDKQTRSRISLLFSVHTYTFSQYLTTEKPVRHLLLWGGQNSVTAYDSHGRYHKNLLRPERFELIKKGGHLCMYEYPQITNDIIEKYIRK